MGLAQLETERRNENTKTIDRVSTIEKLQMINNEDMKVALAVQQVLPVLASAIDEASVRLTKGGHVYYVGAGTSGRLGVLDASECPPTYGVDYDLFTGIMAGGQAAMYKAQEGAEDSYEGGKNDLVAVNLNENDIVVGLAASGRTPYVKGALDYANEIGAQTVSVCCVTNGEISSHATYPIEVICGPESITGSTRMKAGTAQKMVLNMFSSVLMVKAGKVYENLMVDVRPTNEKLVARAKRIIAACTNASEEVAGNALEKSNGDVKVAIITILGDCDVQRAKEILEEHHGHVASAIEALK